MVDLAVEDIVVGIFVLVIASGVDFGEVGDNTEESTGLNSLRLLRRTSGKPSMI